MQWWSAAQKEHQQRLVLYRLRGFPPWPGLVVRTKSRQYLQSPMNPLAPPDDSIFDRVQKCVSRGKGIQKGDTVTAGVWLNAERRPTLEDPAPQKKEKAKILKVGPKWVRVLYKKTGETSQIPKSWCELLSQCILQHQNTGKVKRATGKVRDVALRGSKRGVVPSGYVVVYSYGDEMYRKVLARSLIRYTPEVVTDQKYRKKSLRHCLKKVDKRGFNGARALKEIKAEWDRRERARQERQQQEATAREYRAHHGLEQPPTPAPAPAEREPADRAADRAASKRPLPADPPTAKRHTAQPSQASQTAHARCVATPLVNHARSASAHLQGHMVPYHEQLEGTDVQHISTSDLEEARLLLRLEKGFSVSELHRARRLLALEKHPDKAPAHLKDFRHREWLKIDAAFTMLKATA